jgi:hypothetical protein
LDGASAMGVTCVIAAAVSIMAFWEILIRKSLNTLKQKFFEANKISFSSTLKNLLLLSTCLDEYQLR